MKTIVVCGGAGFIGSMFIRIVPKNVRIVCVDALTYAGHLENLEEVASQPNLSFIKGDIRDKNLIQDVLAKESPNALINFAAESHVDNSISGPQIFLETNIMGTGNLLQCALKYWQELPDSLKSGFRFLQVSTDEVYGQLGLNDPRFDEKTPYAPNSPYSASKAAGDLLVRAWHHTYGLPTILTNCSNNYGPRQFPEKLIPLMILNSLKGKPLPVYGKGDNIRDWIHVEDHARGVYLALTKGILGETYCFGGNSERKNLDVVRSICRILDEVKPKLSEKYESQITFVTDRKGHDFRYAINDSKAIEQLGFQRRYQNFEDGLKDTVTWYLENPGWVRGVTQNNVPYSGREIRHLAGPPESHPRLFPESI